MAGIPGRVRLGDDTARTGESVGCRVVFRGPGREDSEPAWNVSGPWEQGWAGPACVRRDDVGTGRCSPWCAQSPSSASPHLLFPSCCLPHIHCEVFHSDPSVQPCFAAVALLKGFDTLGKWWCIGHPPVEQGPGCHTMLTLPFLHGPSQASLLPLPSLS